MNKEKTGSILPIMAMDSISDAGPDALKITGLVKSGGTVTGYQLSDGRIVSRESGVELAKENKIIGKADGEAWKNQISFYECVSVCNCVSEKSGNIERFDSGTALD